MSRRSIPAGLIALVAIIMAVSGTRGDAAAQGQAWTAWLYHAADGSILKIDRAGNVTGSITLPLSQGFNAYGREVVVSVSGRYTAYTAFDSTQAAPNIQLFIYDDLIGTTRFTYDVSGALAFGLIRPAPALAFDEAAERFAFGYRAAEGTMRVVLGDFVTAAPVAVLDESDWMGAGVPAEWANLVPVVQRVSGGLVWFALTLPGGEAGSQPVSPAFRWDAGTGEVAQDDLYSSPVIDTDPLTGQVVAARFDPTLDYTDMAGSTVRNVVDITRVSGIVRSVEDRARLIHVPDGSVRQVRFIESGARLLVEIASGETRLEIVGRDGSVQGQLLGTLTDLMGTPDGFVGLFNTNGAPALAHVTTTAEPLNLATLWSGAAGLEYTLVRVVPG